jgi:hypothetical protein
MKRIALIFVALLVACGNPSHNNVKVKSFHGWEPGRAKSCMLLNGASAVEDVKPGSDPKAMHCYDDFEKGNVMSPAWEFVYIGKVELDDKSEELFRDTKKHFAVPLLCTRTETQIFSCVYNAN